MCDRKEEKKDEWNNRIKDYWAGQEARAAAAALRCALRALPSVPQPMHAPVLTRRADRRRRPAT